MLLNSLSAVVTLVENDELAAVNDPLILLAICAEPLINVLPNSDSAVVTLLAKLELVDVNEPLIFDAICAEPLKAPLNVPLKVLAVTEPLAYNEPVNSCLSS